MEPTSDAAPLPLCVPERSTTSDAGAGRRAIRQGERLLRNSAEGFEETGERFGLGKYGNRNLLSARVMDAWDPGLGLALESKVGAQRLSRRIKRQIDADVALLGDTSSEVREVVWHFFPSARSGKIADDPELFQYIEQYRDAGINLSYQIHLP